MLPLGASKGAGVEKLLEHLGISADNLMALGDGENDVGMLKVSRSDGSAPADRIAWTFQAVCVCLEILQAVCIARYTKQT